MTPPFLLCRPLFTISLHLALLFTHRCHLRVKKQLPPTSEWKGRAPTGHITHRLWELQGDCEIYVNLSIFHDPGGLGPCPGSRSDGARSRTGCPPGLSSGETQWTEGQKEDQWLE